MDFNQHHASVAGRCVSQRLLGPSDGAEWLGVSAGCVRAHATRKEPRIGAIKVGKLIRAEDVEDFFRESTDRFAPCEGPSSISVREGRAV